MSKQKYLHCSCNSSSFIHDMNNNLVAIVKVKKDISRTKLTNIKQTDVYCLECNKKYIVNENNIITKYLSKTIENYINEV